MTVIQNPIAVTSTKTYGNELDTEVIVSIVATIRTDQNVNDAKKTIIKRPKVNVSPVNVMLLVNNIRLNRLYHCLSNSFTLIVVCVN